MRMPICAMLVIAGMLAQPVARALADDDHERARRALEAGEIVPLDQILQEVQQRYPGTVVEVELEREDRRWVYEVELVAADGRLLKLRLDAGSRQLLREDGG
jgi:uncharacterized membrane protein YkoI